MVIDALQTEAESVVCRIVSCCLLGQSGQYQEMVKGQIEVVC